MVPPMPQTLTDTASHGEAKRKPLQERADGGGLHLTRRQRCVMPSISKRSPLRRAVFH